MPTSRVGVVVVVQNDAETVERSLASYYDHVEHILVSNDPEHGWSGQKIVPDDTLERIRAFDKARKIEIVQADFFRYPDAMQNDTYQRQFTADALAERVRGLDWIAQIDADEEFLDFGAVKQTLGRLPTRTQGVYWRWIPLFNRLEDGRYLVIVDREGQPALEQFPLAHRPGAILDGSRHVQQHIANPFLRRLLGAEYILPIRGTFAQATLHYSFAKSEKRIREKLDTWSHAADFDTDAFFALWQRSKTDWASLRDIHPVFPTAWHALKPFDLDELRAYR